jgi:hypothetical protein
MPRCVSASRLQAKVVGALRYRSAGLHRTAFMLALRTVMISAYAATAVGELKLDDRFRNAQR